LDDLPQELLQGSPRGLPNRLNTSYHTDYSRWEAPANRPAVKVDVPQETRFRPGMQVRHKTYGRGVVKASRLELGDETVEVYFEGYGLKALVASLANLEVL
jgi:DNA helicase-2/ATP-dependent DNA helicase PcrA